MSDPEAITIREAVVDPRWSVGNLILNGHEITFLRITHPRHGDIDILLPDQERSAMVAALQGAAPARGTA